MAAAVIAANRPASGWYALPSAAGDEDDAGDDQDCAGDAAGMERFMKKKISQQGGDDETQPHERISERQVSPGQDIQPDQCSEPIHRQPGDDSGAVDEC